MESAGGIILLIAALEAMVISNSPLSYLYDTLLDITMAVQLGEFVISKPLSRLPPHRR